MFAEARRVYDSSILHHFAALQFAATEVCLENSGKIRCQSRLDSAAALKYERLRLVCAPILPGLAALVQDVCF